MIHSPACVFIPLHDILQVQLATARSEARASEQKYLALESAVRRQAASPRHTTGSTARSVRVHDSSLHMSLSSWY